jgi:hypothetical protein
VNELHALGYSVSYDEVRRFLTSAALDQKTDGVFVPRGIDASGNVLVDAAIDNFDQNEETLDGKNTTHAMAAVLYKRCLIEPSTCQFPRVPEKSLSAVDAFTTDSRIER